MPLLLSLYRKKSEPKIIFLMDLSLHLYSFTFGKLSERLTTVKSAEASLLCTMMHVVSLKTAISVTRAGMVIVISGTRAADRSVLLKI